MLELISLTVYVVSGVINVGWKRSGSEWLRPGDYLAPGFHHVDMVAKTKEKDLEMICYGEENYVV